MVGHIVVGVDGSAHAQHALRWAEQLADALGATVTPVHAVGLLESRDGRSMHPSHWWTPSARAATHDLLTLDGDPVSVLLRAAAQRGADLVVVGTRGMGDRSDLLLGSTSTQVAQRSPVPVVVVPPRDAGHEWEQEP